MPVPDTNAGVNGSNGVNGTNGVHFTDITDEESEEEEAEPVSATLVLRVVSEPPSPAISRKSSFRRDQPPAFLAEDRGEQYLQVQVQRSVLISVRSNVVPEDAAAQSAGH